MEKKTKLNVAFVSMMTLDMALSITAAYFSPIVGAMGFICTLLDMAFCLPENELFK